MRLAFALAAITVLAGTSETDWREFRGPLGNGHSAAKGVPLSWNESKNVKWKTAIPGKGWSSPVVMGDQIWFTTAKPDGTEIFVVCVARRDGKILLNRKLVTNSNPEPIHDVNSYASPTPVLENGRVYVHFGTYGTFCIDTKSLNILWQRTDLHCEHSVGPGSTPVVFNNLLILTFDGIDVQYTVALDKASGKTVWKKDRDVDWAPTAAASNDKGGREQRKSFNTPTLTTVAGKPLLISPGAMMAFGYDPATGKEIWRVRHTGYSNSARTLIGHDLAFIITGYNRSELMAVRYDGTGMLSSDKVAWTYNRNVPFKPSPILVEDLLYMASDGGVLTCLEAKTGKEVWKDRLAGSNFSASPLYLEGRIYFFGEQGKTTVIKPGRKLEVIAENDLESGFMASPAVSGSDLILRTRTHLYCIGAK